MNAVAGAMGWMLLHSLWEGAAVCAVLGAALPAIRSARARYLAATLALAAMLGTFCVTLVCLLPEGAGAGLAQARGAAWTVIAVSGGGLEGSANWRGWVPWLTPLWLAGVLAFAARQMAGYAAVGRLRRTGVCCAPAPWQAALERLSSAMGAVRLMESCLAETPVVLGHWRPVILLPVGVLTGFPAPQLEAILLHELAHVRRHDYLVNAWQRGMEGLLFYHPGVWWISRVMRMERENCCDDLAVKVMGDAHGYAAALAALEESRGLASEPALAATGGSLMKRIRRLLYPKSSQRSWMPTGATLMLIAAAAAIGVAAGQTAGADPARYAKWLNEDVVYIIDDAERASFERLTTDAERDEFVEQFWVRRDPTPGTPVNEFKEEHYRRIASANKHFTTPTGGAGWKTDRGHLYIVYGPPDEIESHSASDRWTYATDEWLYTHVDGVGAQGRLTFVDRTGRGDYRLVPAKP